ncbi:MAG: carbonic anhydrase [Candidatus Saccharibacteria bacterium]
MSHKADAVALSCMDFRFREAVQNFIQNELNIHAFDLKTDGGGVKKLVEEGPVRDWILSNFEIAFSLHGVDKVILINHQDCGAYGGSKAFGQSEEEFRFHEEQLKQASSLVSARYPDKKVEAYLALLTEPITFKKIQ